jgi:hypothetical protein
MATQTYEITVAGRLGPVVRNALAHLRVLTDGPTYVVELVATDAASVSHLIAVLAERGCEPSVLRVSPQLPGAGEEGEPGPGAR